MPLNVEVPRTRLQPLIKWPGGKRWLVKELAPHLPATFSRYIEPFAGGAAIFFALRPSKAILADINADLIETYRMVASDPEAVIAALLQLKNSEKEYYRQRSLTPESQLERAVRLLYLMRFSFNGIYRVNLNGMFNVPYGYKTLMSVCDPEHVRACSRVLQCANLSTSNFHDTLKEATEGDLVYIDPPYTVTHNNNGFLKYNEHIFSWSDQQNLAVGANLAAERGAHVIVSNADHKDLHMLYSSFERITINRYTSVSGISEGRRHVSESLYLRHIT